MSPHPNSALHPHQRAGPRDSAGRDATRHSLQHQERYCGQHCGFLMFWHHTIKGGPVSRPHLAYWRLGSAFVWSMSCFSSSYSSRHHSQAQNHSIALYLPGVPAPGPNPGNHHLFSLRCQGSVSRRISCEWSCTVHEL